MAVKPILYSAPMVRALIAGTKTQTRRVLNPQPPEWAAFCQEGQMYNSSGKWVRTQLWYWSEPEQNPRRELRRWPVDAEGEHYWMRQKYSVGDILWVREGFMPAPMEPAPEEPKSTRWNIAYAAGGQEEVIAPARYNPMLYNYERWSPSIHMPRWASRLTQVVNDVRVQRLQDITEEDAIAEGVFVPEAQYAQQGPRAPVLAFADLWNRINGEGSWEANPWVVAYTVETHLANVDAFLAGRGAGDG